MIDQVRSGKSVRRVVSLAASNTEIIDVLGLTDRLVGVDDFSDYPPVVHRLPRVGPDLNVDVQRIVALQPDLVLASLSVPGMERNVSRLATAGLPYIVVDSGGLPGLWSAMSQVAHACGEPELAHPCVLELRDRVELLTRRLSRVKQRPSVYWEWWPRPSITAGRPSWITEMISRAGGVNLFADLERESAVVEYCAIRKRDPDLVVACWCGARRLPRPAQVLHRPGWSDLRAAREGRVHTLLEPLFGRPGPRLVDGLEQLAHLIHPECFR